MDDNRQAAEPGTNLQTWGSWDEEEAEKDKRETETRGNFFKITEPKNRLRFLPPRMGQKNPFVRTYQHFVELIPGDERTKVIFNCPKKMNKGPCPLCMMAERKKATGKKADRDRAYELFPKLRVYSAVINRKDEDAGVQTFPFGQKIFQQLLNLREDGNFTDPVKGFDVAIFKKGNTKNNTEYLCKPARDTTPLSGDSELMNEWLKSLPDLTVNAAVPTTDEIKEILAAAQDAADQDDDAPQGRRSGGGGGGGGGRKRDDAIDTEGEPVADGDDVWGDGDDDEAAF